MIIRVFCAILLIKEITAASLPGDVVGKLSVGYQGWFSCKGDNSPRNNWVHWASGVIPSPGHQTFEIWPDVQEYTKTYQTGYANLGNGQPAKLFSSYDDQTVEVHLNWINSYGIDTVALQRFGSGIYHDKTSKDYVNGIATKKMLNAQRTNRKFYVMWDISGWIDFSNEIKKDWTESVINFTKSSAYARQNGKPVVCIWGVGLNSRPLPDPALGTREQFLDLISFLKNKGLYVIGGVPKTWRSGLYIKPNFLDVFLKFDMLSPWSVATYVNIPQIVADQKMLSDDLALCNLHNIDYQPVLWPGSADSNWHSVAHNANPRLHGDFMWQQFVNLRTLGIKNAYVAMFDEYDEGTAIAKAANTKAMIPTNQYFLTLDADGVLVSTDFYLRLVNDGNKMMKGQLPLLQKHPTPHM